MCTDRPPQVLPLEANRLKIGEYYARACILLPQYVTVLSMKNLTISNKNHLGKITVQPGATPSKHELRTASVFAKAGIDVMFLKPIDKYRIKTPDIKMANKLWEIKAPVSDKLQAIERNLKKACRQSSNIVFDMRRMKNLPTHKVKKELIKQNSASKAIKNLIFIDKHGKVFYLTS